jgi:ribonuclease VapC
VIVLDTSALAAMFRLEADALRLYEALSRASSRVLPPSCMVEFILLRRYGGDRRTWLARLIEVQDLKIPAFTREMAHLAADAAEHYGRGTGHPARLNFGDCLAYAVAKHLDASLLYKGGDFAHTDIRSAL